jgi:hypothetical protein
MKFSINISKNNWKPQSFIFISKFFLFHNHNKKKDKMGCDGGTIPKRDELVRTKKKKEKV